MEQLMPTEGSTVEPEVPREKLTIEVSVEVLERVDAWRSQQADKPSREEAIERLLVAHFWPNL